jgi:hypothetical protein
MNIHPQQFYQNPETFKTSSFTIICGCTQFLCHYLYCITLLLAKEVFQYNTEKEHFTGENFL